MVETSYERSSETCPIDRSWFFLGRLTGCGIDASAAFDVKNLTVADTRWKILKPLEAFLEIIAYVPSKSKLPRPRKGHNEMTGCTRAMRRPSDHVRLDRAS